MNAPYEVAPDIHILPSHVTIPGVGVLPNNAFLVLGEEPLLVDTGFRSEADEFLEAVQTLVDLSDLRYVFLTHDDADHVGNLERVMEEAPGAQLFAHGLAALRAKFTFDIPLEKVHAIVAGERVDVGGRALLVFRPPLFDNPTTLGIYDPDGGIMFSVDCFGAILPRWEDQASGFSADELAGGLLAWASFDDPWVSHYQGGAWEALLSEARRLPSDLVLSSHLPPARGLFEDLLQILEPLPGLAPFVPPDQAAFAQMAAAMKVAVAAGR